MVCLPHPAKFPETEDRLEVSGLPDRLFFQAEEGVTVAGESPVQDHAEDAAADEFSGSDGEHQKRNRKRDAVSIVQDKRNDQSIGQDRSQGKAELVEVPHPIDEHCANQGGETAEDNIGQDRAGEDVSDQASDKETRHSCRSEGRQDGEGLGDADLDFTESKRCKEPRQDDVDGGDHSRISDRFCFLMFHSFLQLSFIYIQRLISIPRW